jgi:hypothetical protein
MIELRSGSSDKPLLENTPLWRYMKLSTFMWLLSGRMFIPTLRKLQQKDPSEAFIPCDQSGGDFGISLCNLPDFAQAQQWLERHREYEWQPLSEVWLREMAKRTCISCWHRSDIESLALWSVYAEQGVVIRSDFESIKSALEIPEECTGVCGDVHYCDLNTNSESFYQSENLLRPYFFKRRAYQHEAEVRVAIETAVLYDGVTVKVEPRKLLKQVIISPYIQLSEANALCSQIKKLLGKDEIAVEPSPQLTRYTPSDRGEKYNDAYYPNFFKRDDFPRLALP